MKFQTKDVKIKDILLDPYNPRFVDHVYMSQEVLQSKILKTKDARELLSSMKADVKWVNRIVVKDKKNFTEEQRLNIKDAKTTYIVVEGNTRLACLKSGTIKQYASSQKKIPVLVASKESGESESKYLAEVRITQGIANVMVVKEWDPIVKARHLHQIYNDKKTHNKSIKTQDAFKEIANELGMKIAEVRTSVTRYKIYNEIETVSAPLKKEHWGFLEAFDTNPSTRKIIGLNPKTYEFISDDEEENEQYQDFLNDVEKMINTAIEENLNTKQFRDVFKKIVEDKKAFEDVYDAIKRIINKNEDDTWRQYRDEFEKGKSSEEKWEEELKKIAKKLKDYPCAADWAKNKKKRLSDIKSLIDKLLKLIEA